MSINFRFEQVPNNLETETKWEIKKLDPDASPDYSLAIRDGKGSLILINKYATSREMSTDTGNKIPGWAIGGAGTESETNPFEIGRQYNSEEEVDEIIGWGGIAVPKDTELREQHYKKLNWPEEAIEACEEAIKNNISR